MTNLAIHKMLCTKLLSLFYSFKTYADFQSRFKQKKTKHKKHSSKLI